jgi:hypothetical protein
LNSAKICLKVSPSSGVSFDDANPFQFSAVDWADEELPLSYAFFIQSQAPLSTLQGVLPLGSRSLKSLYSTSEVSSGAVDEDNKVKAMLYVYDSLLAYSSTSNLFTVTRPTPAAGETYDSELKNQLTAKYDAAIEQGNPDKLMALVNAVSATASTPLTCDPLGFEGNYTAKCADLKRLTCTAIADVCGPCQTGYTTPFGSNYIDNSVTCTLESSSRRLQTSANGASCTSNSDCTYENCEDGICTMPRKECTKVFGQECSGNGTCIYLDHKAEPVLDCRFGDADCFAYCMCNNGTSGFYPDGIYGGGPYGGDACQYDNATFYLKDALNTGLCQTLIDQASLRTLDSSYLAEYLTSLQSAFKPFEARAPGIARCVSAMTIAFNMIDDDQLIADQLTSDDGNTPPENAALLLSALVDGYLNTGLYNRTKDTSSLDMTLTDTQYLLEKANLLMVKIMEVKVAGTSSTDVITDHVRISARYPAAADLENGVISPPETSEQSTYGHKMLELELPADGMSRCSSEKYVPYGIMEWGIMPVANTNYSGIEDLEAAMVTLTLGMPSTVPEFGIYSRYNVSLTYQQSIAFNISYPYEGFNRTYPALYTSDVIDGSNFVMNNCNASYFTDYNTTFDCPDFGRLCSENTDNSGYKVTIGTSNYMINGFTGGKYFLQGIYTDTPTSAPTGQPTGEPTSVPSGQPSAQPSSAPSTIPSAQPSAIPTCEPTSKPSGQPSSLPTSTPTTSAPTSRPTRTLYQAIEMNIQQRLEAPGLTKAKFMQSSYKRAFVSAVANITNLMPADVNITSVAELYSGRRRLQTLLGVTVNYTLEFAIDDSANSATEINNMQSTLVSASNSSDFTGALKAAAVENGDSTLISDFTSVTVSVPTTVSTSTKYVSQEPTSAPSSAPSTSTVINDGDSDGPPIVAIVVPVVLFFVACVSVGIYYYRQQKRLENESGEGLTQALSAI